MLIKLCETDHLLKYKSTVIDRLSSTSISSVYLEIFHMLHFIFIQCVIQDSRVKHVMEFSIPKCRYLRINNHYSTVPAVHFNYPTTCPLATSIKSVAGLL